MKTITLLTILLLAGCASPQAVYNYRPMGQAQMSQAQAHAQCQWQAMQAGNTAGAGMLGNAYYQVRTMDLCMAAMGYGR